MLSWEKNGTSIQFQYLVYVTDTLSRSLLPTNCLRACTAVVTEVSFNHSDNAEQVYAAEIEFIEREDWFREVTDLYGDLADNNSDGDADAKAALAKLNAVYPALTQEDLAKTTPAELQHEPSVNAFFGVTKKLYATNSQELTEQLKLYIDSKEKTDTTTQELWPLIKVVRLKIKAEALSTGAVIVDLPGVHDSNAARAAVAANYMKACTGVWVVTPINRAVDDKSAKTLMGDVFKRQLRLDCNYGNVSIICSKTDDIAVDEAADSLHIKEEIQFSWNEAQELKSQLLEHSSALTKAENEKKALRTALDSCDEQIDVYEKLAQEIEEGSTRYAPKESPAKKRKRSPSPVTPCKKRGAEDETDMAPAENDDPETESEEDAQDEGSNDDEMPKEPLTVTDANEKAKMLKQEKAALRALLKEKAAAITAIKQAILSKKVRRRELEAQIRMACIRGRNEYVKEAIRKDFVAGLKE